MRSFVLKLVVAWLSINFKVLWLPFGLYRRWTEDVFVSDSYPFALLLWSESSCGPLRPLLIFWFAEDALAGALPEVLISFVSYSTICWGILLGCSNTVINSESRHSQNYTLFAVCRSNDADVFASLDLQTAIVLIK